MKPRTPTALQAPVEDELYDDDDEIVIDDEDEEFETEDVPSTIADDEGVLVPEGYTIIEELTSKKPGFKKKAASAGTGNGKATLVSAAQKFFMTAGDSEMARTVLHTMKKPKLANVDWWDINASLGLHDSDFKAPKITLTAEKIAKAFMSTIDNEAQQLGFMEDDERKAETKKEKEKEKGYKAAANWLLACIEMTNKLKEKIASIPGAEKHTAPLGRFAFAPNRNKRGEVPLEPNTSVEDEMINAINGHYGDNEPIPAKIGNSLKALMRKGMYSDVIHEPNVTYVYRGMKVSKSWLQKTLKLKSANDIKGRGELEKSFTFRPLRGSSTSWTTSEKVAWSFAGPDKPWDDYVYIVMVAALEDNPNAFLAGADGTYKLRGPSDFKNEKETTGLGSIKVSKIKWKAAV